MTAALLPRRHRSRSLYIVSLIFAAFLGFIASPLITGYSDCRIKLPKRDFASAVSPPVIALRIAAHEEAESDTPAIARWIDQHAFLLLVGAVAFVAILALLLALAMYFAPYRTEPEHLADGDTGPWPQFRGDR